MRAISKFHEFFSPLNRIENLYFLIEVGKAEASPLPTCTKSLNFNRCTCGKCVVMPTARECICCEEINQVVTVKNEETVQCITDHPGFRPICLDMHVLRVAYYQYRQQYGERPEQANEYVTIHWQFL